MSICSYQLNRDHNLKAILQGQKPGTYARVRVFPVGQSYWHYLEYKHVTKLLLYFQIQLKREQVKYF